MPAKNALAWTGVSGHDTRVQHDKRLNAAHRYILAAFLIFNFFSSSIVFLHVLTDDTETAAEKNVEDAKATVVCAALTSDQII